MPLYPRSQSSKAVESEVLTEGVAVHSYRIPGVWKKFAARDLPILLLSIVFQLFLGLFFGHFYDMRIFMATGYLVGTGQNPYLPQDLTAVFNNSAFQQMTAIGYPPPWLIILGLLYRGAFSVFSSLLFYNLVIKIPIIIANIGIAYLVAEIFNKSGSRYINNP